MAGAMRIHYLCIYARLISTFSYCLPERDLKLIGWQLRAGGAIVSSSTNVVPLGP